MGNGCFERTLAEEGTHTDIEVNCEGLRYGSSDRMYYVPSRSFEEYLRTVTDEQLADVKSKLAAAIGIEPQIVEKDVVQKVPVEAPSAAVPTKTEKECDAEVQETAALPPLQDTAALPPRRETTAHPPQRVNAAHPPQRVSTGVQSRETQKALR